MTRPKRRWYMTQFGGVAHSEHPDHKMVSDCGKVLVREAGKYDKQILCEKCGSIRRVRANHARKAAK